MPQQPNDDDVAEFLDDSDWTAPVKINATSVLNRWTRWCTAAGTTVLGADRKTLRAYLAERQAAEIAASTRKKDWQVIRAFYTWAATPSRQRGGGLLTDDPMDSVRPPSVPSRPQTRARPTWPTSSRSRTTSPSSSAAGPSMPSAPGATRRWSR